MSEIEKMKRYIDRTKINKHDTYAITFPEATELLNAAQDTNDLFAVVDLAFNYGRAKGYRAAKAETRK